MLRLLRCRLKKSGPSREPPIIGSSSPSWGTSTLMTSAPQSANWRAAVGPARARVRSITLKRDNGPCRVALMDVAPGQAIAVTGVKSWQASRQASSDKHDLAEVRVGAHVRQRSRSLIEGEGAVDRQLQLAALDVRPQVGAHDAVD